MEIMKKNLRSVKRMSNDTYEYLRIDAEEAKQLVDAGTHIYISKEEYKRQSKFYQMIPCNGTLVKQVSKTGNVSYKSLHNINYAKHLGEKFPSSTKIAKCSMNSGLVRRKNKYLMKPAKALKRL